MSNQIVTGDALETLRTLASESVQCCVTSPPYYGLRDYGVEGQIGLEETPEAYVEKLAAVFREVKRVLRDDGTLWLNLGDSYAARLRQSGVEHVGELTQNNRGTIVKGMKPLPSGYKEKDLIGIPWMVAFALRSDGWYLRSDCIWHKPTAMPESVTDRPTTAHEHIFLLAKSERYFYDADAIREPLRPKTFTTFGIKHQAQGNDALGLVKSDNWGRTVEERQPRLTADGEIAGANKRTVWTVSSQAYNEAHFATFPPKLIEPCILAGTSPRACEQCGAPWERVIAPTGHINKREPAHAPYSSPTKVDSTGWAPTKMATATFQPTCSCLNEGTGKCVVLDPFMGAGTVALVAIQHHRRYLGVELNPVYIALAEKRIAHVQQGLWTCGSEVSA